MNFLFDNNLPPAYAKSFAALSQSEWGTAHHIIHLKDKFPQNTKDEVWINTLSSEKNWVVITHDLLNKGLEREVLRQADLIVFMLDKSWGHHKFWDNAYQLTRWWPAIVQQAERISGGVAFKVAWNFRGKGKFKAI